VATARTRDAGDVRLEIRDVSEGSVLVEFPDVSDADANRAAIALASRLFSARSRAGLLDAIPGARTLYLAFPPRAVSREALGRRLRRADPDAVSGGQPDSRLFRIPVAYGGENGPDLTSLARDRGIDEEELARRHQAAEYAVAFLGFSPGFAYLTGLPPELHAPRLPTPRSRVAAGSVAIGGEYTAIYPEDSPGGWRLIGRSPVSLFDPWGDPPALLRSGDRVRFERILPDELDRRLAARVPRKDAAGMGEPILAVIAPGLFTTVQGAPRHGLGSSGVPAGGAMDEEALERGNAAVGNAAGAAALEITMSGPQLRVLGDAVLCVSGGDLAARWNGKLVDRDVPFEVRAGDHVAFGYTGSGARAYLCVRGGLVERRAGEPLRRVARGDVVARRAAGEAGNPRSASPAVSEPVGPRIVRVLPGPQASFFPQTVTDVFFSSTYRVSAESDRRGIRLDGPAVEPGRPADIPPEGTALGAIQVPASGLPIVLGPDRPVTGGYAKIATVIRADWPRLAQAPLGTPIRFRPTGLEEALAELPGAGDGMRGARPLH
jgi:antagonist of KipI